jgi:hypothetical protein
MVGGDATVPEPAMPRIFAAHLGPQGAVVRERELTRTEAEARRRSGGDVVVCGPDLAANRRMAQQVEQAANGSWKRHAPHDEAGPEALPHFQPQGRPPEGHTFYETPNKRAR